MNVKKIVMLSNLGWREPVQQEFEKVQTSCFKSDDPDDPANAEVDLIFFNRSHSQNEIIAKLKSGDRKIPIHIAFHSSYSGKKICDIIELFKKLSGFIFELYLFDRGNDHIPCRLTQILHVNELYKKFPKPKKEPVAV